MYLAATVLRNNVFLLLFLFIFFSCDNKHKEYAENVFPYSRFPQEKELRGEVIELDTALFRYPFRIRIEGDKEMCIRDSLWTEHQQRSSYKAARFPCIDRGFYNRSGG